MTSATDDLRLSADFAPASYDDWRKLVDSVLKGAPFEKLVGKTYDGLRIEPIYARAHDAAPVAGRAAAAPWQIMQRVDHPDAAQANAMALHDLENGATGLEIEFAGGPGARGFGITDVTRETVARVFDGVFFDAGIAIALNPVLGGQNAGLNLADLIESKGFDPAKVDVRFNYQPLSTMAVRGATPAPWPEMERPFAKAIGDLMGRGFKGPFALADGRPVHDAGGSEAQELAFTLAVAVVYLRALEVGGIALDVAPAALSFRLSADADQFLTMAKFRALRLLWARVEQACGLAPKPIFIAVETAWRMLTQRDAYVNMLRATIATFSAGLGGANAITVLPHTLALGLPDPFARRAARNTQLVLLEESNLAKVSDPAAGSGGIEALTQQLCEAAWSLFQEIEKAGGVFAALEQGLIQRKVAATRTVREANIARRKEVLTGASEFPNLHEADVAVLDAKPVALAPAGEAEIKFDALTPMRLAEPFERLRDTSDDLLKRTGARPKVFLANLGTPADFTARATFAKSFFETGGIEAVDFLPSTSPLPSGERSTPQVSGEGVLASDRNPSPTASPSAQERPLPMGEVKALTAAFKTSGAALACLCSSDKIYAGQAIAAAKALQAAGAKHIYLAGRPGEQETALRAAGVNDFIFAGCEALATLQEAYRLME
ncbi:MAG: methylmalonyl-CoA mutase [Bradyrhizobium sp.]|nr:methylmalonyl-CoA mutase [Bradyrhizobium sp.]